MVKSVILCQVGKGFHFQKSIANKVSSWVPDPPGAPLARVPGGSPPRAHRSYATESSSTHKEQLKSPPLLTE